MLKNTPSPSAALAAALAAAVAGCGPIGATSLIADAEIACARAHAADGDRHAIYETTSADLYLEKAKEEQGHAHYGPAMELAKKSVELAEAATLRAAQSRTGAAPPAPAPTIAHPPGESQAPSPRPMVAEPPARPPAPEPAPGSSSPPLVKPADAPPAQRPVLIPGQPAPQQPKPPDKKEKQPISPEGVQ